MSAKKKIRGRHARPENWYCIASGRLLLPFTARLTRTQAIKDYTARDNRTGLNDYESVVKIIVCRASDGYVWRPLAGRQRDGGGNV